MKKCHRKAELGSRTLINKSKKKCRVSITAETIKSFGSFLIHYNLKHLYIFILYTGYEHYLYLNYMEAM